LKVAVVGAGISGASAAWLLSRSHEVTLFEKEPRLGGHSDTVEVAVPEGVVPVDMGFIVYNTMCYPNLIALFAHFDVPTAPTSMSFAVSLDNGGYEYSGNGAAGLFGQRSNLFRPSHWRMASDVFRFFREARELVIADADPGLSLADWLAERRYSQAFIERHIVPMGAAIWSTPAAEMMRYPVAAFVRFFANHGLLQATGQPEWRTVKGGSREYVARLRAGFGGRVIAGDAVVEVQRGDSGATIRTASGHVERFDACLLATHADDTLAMLGDADARERALLGSFRYATNEAVLHSHTRHMPKRRHLWASWNYLGGAAPDKVAVTYWMNNLQPLATRTPYFVTLNPVGDIDRGHVVKRTTYRHPMYDTAAITAQKQLWSLQGRRGTWFAGSYFGHGFHEDGLQSGLAAAEALGGVRRPWSVAGENSRLHIPPGTAGRDMVLAAE
jgi:predicted NAD/FAD-binding protein